MAKTNHQTGYHKPVNKPTTNYPMDTHKNFCKRCLGYNRVCPMTGKARPTRACSV